MNEQTDKIQLLILKWLKNQANPIRHDKIRDICHSCLSSVTDQEDKNCLYKFFYPLVRAGLIEAIKQDGKIYWQLSAPSVFKAGQSYIGINLTHEQQKLLPSEIITHVHPHVIRWNCNQNSIPDSLPLVNNPPVLTLLNAMPACRPKIFSKKCRQTNLPDNIQIYSCQTHRWENAIAPHNNGYYRMTDQVYSAHYYLQNEQVFSVDNDIHHSCWAKIQHCIDHNQNVGIYDFQNKSLRFLEDLPFIISRILQYNQISTHFTINQPIYHNINQEKFRALQRIFCGKIKINEGTN